MLFNSIAFALFLTAVFSVYWAVGESKTTGVNRQNIVLLISNVIFYGLWSWKFLVLVFAVSLLVWICGIAMTKFSDRKRFINSLCVVICVCILGLFKYYDFFAQCFANVFLGGKSDKVLLNLILPVGISFYIFKAVSYSLEVYKGTFAARNDFITVFNYLSFFPQILAGPIARPKDLIPQLESKRVFTFQSGADGMRLIIWGLFKKVVVADGCAIYVNEIWNNISAYNGSSLVLALLLFPFQVYADFSGYSDMAIGIGKLLGFKTQANFLTPLFSRSIREFWRKWHISLTSWFTDYVYIPLGGNRCPKKCIIVNTMIVFAISGLWHGANWTFILWGLYNGMLFIPGIIMGRKKKVQAQLVVQNTMFPAPKEAIQMVLTFMLFLSGLVIFRADSIGQFLEYLSQLFTSDILCVPYLKNRLWYIPTFISVFIMMLIEWYDRNDGIQNSVVFRKVGFRFVFYYAILFAVFFFTTNTQNFIYFDF